MTESTNPRSIRHKRILDAASERPDASFEAIASGIPSVSPELVERVLDEFGDLSSDEDDACTGPDERDAAPTVPDVDLALDALADTAGHPEPQHELLRTIADRTNVSLEDPPVVQRESARRTSDGADSIEAPDERNQEALVARLLEREEEQAMDGQQSMEDDPGDRPTVDGAPGRYTAQGDREGARRVRGTPASAFDDPELLHKVVRACIESESIDESDELEILRVLIP